MYFLLTYDGGPWYRLLIRLFAICLLLIPNITFGAEKTDMVLVVKSQSRLYLIKNDIKIGGQSWWPDYDTWPEEWIWMAFLVYTAFSVSNSAMDAIWKSVDVGIPIEIKP